MLCSKLSYDPKIPELLEAILLAFVRLNANGNTLSMVCEIVGNLSMEYHCRFIKPDWRTYERQAEIVRRAYGDRRTGA